jgi:uncharacterized protein YlzI (FlbEa/FlbD family)
MILAVSLVDGQIVALSADHIVLITKSEDQKEEGDYSEITLSNGKKFVLQGKVQDLATKFNVSRR